MVRTRSQLKNLSKEEFIEDPLHLVPKMADLLKEQTLLKTFHVIDTEKLFGIDNLDDFISSTSF